VAGEYGGGSFGEFLDIFVNFLRRAKGEEREGSASDLGAEEVRELFPVSPPEIATLARRAMFEWDGEDARDKCVVRAVTGESLALHQKRPEGRL
jgi:hypothetical protein